jgi:DNA polymerase III alpha subunit
VNQSRHETRISGKTIYIGFVHVQNLEQSIIAGIVNERQQHGEFSSLSDFIERTSITKEQLVILIRLGALRFTGISKAELLWKAHMLLNKTVLVAKTKAMFEAKPREFALPKLEQSVLGDAWDEIELLGFPVSLTAFDLLQTNFRGELTAKNLMANLGRNVRMLGRLVTIKYVRTVRKEIMHFGTFTDVEGEFFDTVHFPPSLKNYPFRGDGMYLILGKVVEEFGFPSIEVEKMAKMPFQANPKA